MPDLLIEVEGCAHPRSLTGSTTVLAFCARWTAASEALRAELRGLGATLLVLTKEGGVQLGPDDPPERLRPAPALWSAFSVELPPALTLLLLDPDGAVRMRCSSDEAVEPEPLLLGALRSAGKAVRARTRGSGEGGRSRPDGCSGRARSGGADDREPGRVHDPRERPRGMGRRDLLLKSLASALAVAVLDACATPRAAGTEPPRLPVDPNLIDLLEVSLEINGESHKLHIDPRTTLLDALRENLGLTGTKKGCDMGQCGACTVLVDGKRIDSCLALAAQHDGRKITTIEGLAEGSKLHPMQAAFIEEDAFQCGYCTPGQILSAVALLREGRASTDEEIREGMSGNLCRCGAYPNILAAIRRVTA